MLHVDFNNLSHQVIGDDHGLNLDALLNQNESVLQNALTKLYQEKDTAGGWKRWLNLGYDDALVSEIEQYAQSVKGQFTDMVVLGIGGSSLGGFAMLKALLHPYWNDLPAEKRNGLPRFYFVENVDADQIRGLMDILDMKTTLFNVISKSGTTAETMSAFMLVKSRLEEQYGEAVAAKNIVVTTDRNKGILRDLVNTYHYQAFEVPDDVGGRFSVFSAVGMLPAALVGISLKELQKGIRELDEQFKALPAKENPVANAALYQVEAYKKGKTISVLMPYSYRLAAVADWYVQLWAESLGKKHDLDGNVVHVGPNALKAVGVTDQHSQIQLYNEGLFDKIITFVQVESPDRDLTIPPLTGGSNDLDYLGGKSFSQLLNAEFISTRASLTQNQRLNVTLKIPAVDAYHFAQLLYFLEVQTAIAGALLNVDPFDQPGVELAKQYTYALMGRAGHETLKKQLETALI